MDPEIEVVRRLVEQGHLESASSSLIELARKRSSIYLDLAILQSSTLEKIQIDELGGVLDHRVIYQAMTSVARSILNVASRIEQETAELIRCEVLLTAVNEAEVAAVLNEARARSGSEPVPHYDQLKTFYRLGEFGGARVVLMRSEQGSGGPDGSILSVYEGIVTVAPLAVILVGTAFGVDSKKQRLGELLVSTMVIPYELQRVSFAHGTEPSIIPRGGSIPASSRLLDRCRDGALSWQSWRIRFGGILSGEKLVDNIDFRQQLIGLAPEAVGGEMEAAGVFAVCHRKKIDWIVVKAISDWGDGNKSSDEDQALAAGNAARFVFDVVERGGLT